MAQQSPFMVFLNTVHCRFHHVLFADCPCSTFIRCAIFDRGEPVVQVIQALTGCSVAEAWAQWADDTGSVASTSAQTFAYHDASENASDASEPKP
jgi:hypothetical protein